MMADGRFMYSKEILLRSCMTTVKIEYHGNRCDSFRDDHSVLRNVQQQNNYFICEGEWLLGLSKTIDGLCVGQVAPLSVCSRCFSVVVQRIYQELQKPIKIL